jgi:hypothetical protein
VRWEATNGKLRCSIDNVATQSAGSSLTDAFLPGLRDSKEPDFLPAEPCGSSVKRHAALTRIGSSGKAQAHSNILKENCDVSVCNLADLRLFGQ